MSKKDDTFEMLEEKSAGFPKSVLIPLLILLLVGIGIAAYIFKQHYYPVKSNITMGDSLKNTPALSPLEAASNNYNSAGTTATAQGKTLVPVTAIVNFDEQSVTIKPEQMLKIQSFCQQIKDWEGTVEISGYTDNLGSASNGLILSRQRADNVAAVLKGLISDSRFKFTIRGFGEENPIGDNTTTGGRAKNRRVEIKFAPAS
jgi:outer membrane protein OmpA-like peptidoglycan-associated protein